MAYLNRIQLLGRLTRDPEIRVTPKGKRVAKFRFATNRPYNDEAGNRHYEECYIDVEAWGKQADLCEKYLKEGMPALIEGRLVFNQWEDRETHQKRSMHLVHLENVQFLSSRDDAAEDGADDEGDDEEGGQAPRYSPPPSRSRAPEPDDDGAAKKAPKSSKTATKH